MNKRQLSAAVAKKVGLSQTKAAAVIDAVFNADSGVIANELNRGGKVTIPGFGTFKVRQREARTGTNPATGARISIPSRSYAAFRAGKTLKERLE